MAVVRAGCAFYTMLAMDAEQLPGDPFALFSEWLKEAEAGEPHDANAMALATASPGGRASVRMVLLKDVSRGGFVFYTNRESRKGRELTANAEAALLFHWKSLRRQVRIEGAVQPVDAEEADAYFASRPRGAQLGAWASDQSRPLSARAELEERTRAAEKRFAGGDVPRPPHWSGWRLLPDCFEFWVDCRDRLHERYTYEHSSGGGWERGMLFP